MNTVMDALTRVFPDHGIALMVFDLDAPGRMNYICTAERASMLVALKEFIARHEGRMMKGTETKQ
jgi:hypothetical protein